MLKNKIGSLVLVMGVTACLVSCGSSSSTTSSTGGASGATGGASGTGGRGGGAATATGGASAGTGGAGAGGNSGTVATLAAACTKNCALAAGLATCSTTTTVCEQSCLKTFDNTSMVNPDLGRQYREMMICVANSPKFSTQAGFVCAKPDRALNKWSPGPDSECEELICEWNCGDGTTGNFDPFVDIRCACSSV